MISRYAQEEIEKSRKKALLCQRVDYVALGFAVLVAVILFIKFINIGLNHGRQESIFIPVLIGTLVVGIPWGIAKKEYIRALGKFESMYKKYLVRAVLDEQLDDVEYVGEHGFSLHQIQKFQLSALANKVGSEDYLRANYHGVVFESSDVLIRYVQPHEKDVVLFRGRMMQLPYSGEAGIEVKIFSKDFKFRMDSESVLVDFFGITQCMVGADVSDQVKTTDANFNRKFDVFCANEQAVDQLLTPILMETLKQLHIKYDSIAFRFTENTLYVAIDSGENCFKRYPDQPIDYEAERRKLISEIDEIKMLVDILNLGCQRR